MTKPTEWLPRPLAPEDILVHAVHFQDVLNLCYMLLLALESKSPHSAHIANCILVYRTPVDERSAARLAG